MYQTLDTIQPEQIDGLIKSHNYRYVSLRDSAGRVLIPNNQSGQSALKNRVLEVKQRLQVVPDNSIYYIILKNTTHGEEWAYKYIKGNPVQIINTAPAPSSMSEPTQYANYADKVSEQAAEIARLKNEIDNLKLSFMYESKLAEMNAKIAQLSEPREPEKNVLQGFAENILPTFIPLFEKYLDVRQLEAQTKIATPQLSEKANTAQQLPAVGSEQYNRMVDRLGQLSDDEFNTRINYLASIDQNYADTVLNEFTTDDEPQTPSDEE